MRRAPAAPADNSAERLLRALSHRGPDGEGKFQSENGLVTFLHARLAILDPSKAGAQPMMRDGNAITFNGEIYNYRDLRRELEKEGHLFLTGTDTEVILALYERDGPKCVSRLRGMFAFAIWDERRHQCFLARDRFGIKPLYYAQGTQGEFVFGSEIKGLLATGLIERRLDPVGLESFLTTGSVAEPSTILQGVRCLEAGCTLTWEQGQLHSNRYFTIHFCPEKMTALEARERTHDALIDSVRRHFVSDVPVGIFLSGGLDSGALVALAHEAGIQRPATFSIGVEGQNQDESDAARERAKQFGTEHHEMLLTRELAWHWLDKFMEAFDQPTVDGFNTFCVAKLAADHGYRVALSGLGGDELFGGYPSFRQIPNLLRAGRLATPLRGVGRNWRPFRKSGRTARLAGFLAGKPTTARAYETVRSIFSQDESRQISATLLENREPWPHEGRNDAAHTGEVGDEISRLELSRYLRNQLLRDSDVMGMVHAVEIRVPFVDHELFDALRRIPSSLRLARGKSLLHASTPGLRSSKAFKKQGFVFPFDTWLNGGRRDLKEELIGAPDVALDTWSRKWSLIVLNRWLKRNGLEGWSK